MYNLVILLLIACVFMLWIITCTVFSALGFIIGKNYAKKGTDRPREPTEKEVKAIKMQKKYWENLMTYDGKPQK